MKKILKGGSGQGYVGGTNKIIDCEGKTNDYDGLGIKKNDEEDWWE